MILRIKHPEKLVYPETDGKPMGENTTQVKWIVSLYNNLQAVFRDRPDVFVAADLFWYPVYGDPTTVTAPDVMVAFGRPKEERPSYKQWEEADTPPQVVFEILSPTNTVENRDNWFKFYRKYGVEEYYEYNPDAHALQVWVRAGRKLVPVKDANGFVSPRLGVRFAVPGTEPMTVFGPDGKRFRDFLEIAAEATAAQERAARLAAKLRELGVDPDAV